MSDSPGTLIGQAIDLAVESSDVSRSLHALGGTFVIGESHTRRIARLRSNRHLHDRAASLMARLSACLSELGELRTPVAEEASIRLRARLDALRLACLSYNETVAN